MASVRPALDTRPCGWGASPRWASFPSNLRAAFCTEVEDRDRDRKDRQKGVLEEGRCLRTGLRAEVCPGTAETAARGRTGAGGNATRWPPVSQRAARPPGTPPGRWCTPPPPGALGPGGRRRAGWRSVRRRARFSTTASVRATAAGGTGTSAAGTPSGNLGGLGAYLSICGSPRVTYSGFSSARGFGKS